MKKLISLMLALIMVFSLATVASAEEGDEAANTSVTYTAVTPEKLTITDGKQFTYTPADGKSWDVTGDVTFGSYTATLNGSTIDATGFSAAISKADGDSTDLINQTKDAIVVTFPTLTSAGKYVFTFKEASTNVQGATLSTETFNVAVYVGYDHENNQLVVLEDGIDSWITDANGEKIETMTNTFAAHSFTIAKDVDGNMANENDKFYIRVTLTADEGKVIATPIYVKGEKVTACVGLNTYTTTLQVSESDGEISFEQVPEGVSVTVAELASENGEALVENDKVSAINDNSGNGEYTYDSTKNSSFELNADGTQAVVKNVRTAQINMGVVTDSAPYIILIAVCAVAAVAFVLKRRNAVEF